MMPDHRPFIPVDLWSRLGYAAGTAVCAVLLLPFLGHGAQGWNAWNYGLFIGSTSCLSFAMCKWID